MSGLILTITNAGRTALVNAANTGTNAVLMASVGVSATSFSPSPATTSLPGEIKRISTLSGEAVADDTIHVTVRDESADIYTVRSFGLYLSDGTLFAVYSQANPIMEKSAQALLLLAIDVIFADIDAAQIAFGDASFLNPPATTERQGVVELATEAETTAGSDPVRAVTPRGLKAAVTSWLDTRFGEGAPSTFVKGMLTSASAAVFRTALGLKSAALKDEGAGNGLDADLLDGQHASAFAPAIHGHGIGDVSGLQTALNGKAAASHGHGIGDVTGLSDALNAKLAASSYTAQDVLAKLLTVDGSGSGLEADLWDGEHRPVNFGRATAGGSSLDASTDPMSLPVGGSLYSNHANNGHGGTTAYVMALAGGDIGQRGFFLSAQVNSSDLLMLSRPAGWTRVWTAGNDGAGSGLDADLWRGKALPSNFASTMFGGSPLDSTTDPQTLAVGGSLYSTNANNGHGGAAAYIACLAGGDIWSRGLLFSARVGSADLLIRSFPDAWTRVWTAGNDGSGSGLDADMLDGLHASDFAKLADFVASKTTNGYCKLPNGMILQAGRFTATNDTTVTVTFPIAFPNLCMGVVVSGTANLSADAQDNNPAVRQGTVLLNQFQVFNAADTTQAFFIAFGY